MHTHTHKHTNERAREREIDSWGSIQMLFSYVLFIRRFMCLTLFSSIYAVNEFLFSFRFTPELHCESSSCNNQLVYIRELQQLNGFRRENPLKMYFHVMFSLLFLSFRAHSNEMKTQLKCKLIQKIDFLYSNVHFRWNGNVKHLIRVFSSSLLMLRKVFSIFNSENRCNNLRRKNPSNFNSFSIFHIFNKDYLGNALSLLYTDVCRQRFILLSLPDKSKTIFKLNGLNPILCERS